LTDRLSKLEAAGVIVRHADGGTHPEYHLSASGLDLWSLYLAMWQWQSDWEDRLSLPLSDDDRPRAALRHNVCGRIARPVYRCASCCSEVFPSDTRLRAAVDLSPSSAEPWPMGGLTRKARARGAPPASLPVLLQVLGDRWSCALVGAAFQGVQRFSEFERALLIRPKQLTDRLTRLQQLGILRRDSYAGQWQRYKLTPAGLGLFPTVVELLQWGGRWLEPPSPGTPRRVHHRCGQELFGRWHCGHCNGVLSRREVRFDVSMEGKSQSSATVPI
jgi:DNA-binding HxlR family transcriptional regulator